MNETAILIFDSSFYYVLFFSQRFLSYKPPVNTCMLMLMFQYMYRQIPVHARVHSVWRVFKWEITFEIGERTFVERLNAHTTVLQWRIINDCIMFGGIVEKKTEDSIMQENDHEFLLNSCNKYAFNSSWIKRLRINSGTSMHQFTQKIYEKFKSKISWIYDIIDFKCLHPKYDHSW